VGLFRKKPVLVEAIRFDGLESIDDIPTPMFEGSFDLVPEWLVEARAKGGGELGAVYELSAQGRTQLAVNTLEGGLWLAPGDFLIKGTAGELYPCKPEIFSEIYEAVDEAAARALASIDPPAEPVPGVGRHELTAGEEETDA
jgi:hypothetical protein